MKDIDMAALLNPDNGSIKDSEEIKTQALKQLSRCRFDEEDNVIKVQVKVNEELIIVTFTDELKIKDVHDQLYIMLASEPSTELLRTELGFLYQENSLIAVLKKYKDTHLVEGASLQKEVFFKLYNPKRINDPYRDFYRAKWIDYEKQLTTENRIYDEYSLNGLWAFPINMLPKIMNDECKDRYGNRLFIVSPIPSEKYFLDGKEIIGDSYEVIDNLDLSELEDVGTLCEVLLKHFTQLSDDLKKTVDDLAAENRDMKQWINSEITIRKKLEIAKFFMGLLIGIIIMLMIR